MKIVKLTFEQIMEKRVKKLEGEKKLLQEQLDAAIRRDEKHKAILEDSGFNSFMSLKKRVRDSGLKDYHFAFNKEDFDKFIKRIDCSPNEYFTKIIQGAKQ